MARGGADLASVKGLSLVAAVLVSCLGLSTCAFNITKVLEPYPNFSQLSQWLTTAGVDDEVNNQTSCTILAPSNSVLQGYLNGINAWSDPAKVGDTLRYHVLLTYYGLTELQTLNSNGTSVTTLLQTTGRANASQGFVTLYRNGTTYLVGHRYTDTYGNETILGNITQSPYVYSILEVSAVLAPVTPSLPSPAPAPSPLSLAPPPNATTLPVTPDSAPSSNITNPIEPPADTTNQGSYASTKSIGKPVLVLAILLSSAAALL